MMKRSLVAFAGMLTLALLPLFIVTLPPLVDYPQHLARLFVLVHYEDLPPLQTFYVPNWGWQPNLALEVVGVALSKVVSVEMAGKIFLGLLLALMASGTVALHLALHGRWSLWPLLGFFVLYNRVLLGGIVNYLFALGLALWATAAWVHFRQSSPWLRMAVSAAFAFALYVAHLSAFAVYGLTVACYEIARHLSSGRPWYRPPPGDVAVAAVPFVPPVLVFLFLSTTWQQQSGINLWDPLNKLTAPLNLVYNYSPILDGATFLILLALFGVGLATHRLRFAPHMPLPIAVIVVVFLLLPDGAFDANGADRRLTVVIALLAIASTDWRLQGLRWEKAAIVGLAALFVLRMAVVTVNWYRANAIYEEYFQAFTHIEPGRRMAAIEAHTSWQVTENPPLSYIGLMAVPQRLAFVPCMYVNPVQQPIAFTPEYAPVAQLMKDCVFERPSLAQLHDPVLYDELTPYRPDRLRSLDYLLVINEQGFPKPVPDGLVPVFTGDRFRLLRVPPAVSGRDVGSAPVTDAGH